LTNGCRALMNDLPLSPADTTLVARFRGRWCPSANSPGSEACLPPPPLAGARAHGTRSLPGEIERGPLRVAAGVPPHARRRRRIRIPPCCGPGSVSSHRKAGCARPGDPEQPRVELRQPYRSRRRTLGAVRGPSVGTGSPRRLNARTPRSWVQIPVSYASAFDATPWARPCRRLCPMPPTERPHFAITSSMDFLRPWPGAFAAASRRLGAALVSVQRIEPTRAGDDRRRSTGNRARVIRLGCQRSRLCSLAATAGPVGPCSSGGSMDGTCC
jgi:hypothetical protein